MTDTPNLGLPFIEAGQAQKHVTHNEALRLLDTVVQLAVSAVSAAPPGSPAAGERHIVGASPSGAFAGHAGEIAVFLDGAWEFFAPKAGWRCWNLAEETLLVWDGSAWQEFSSGGGGFDPDDVEHLYINGADPGDADTKLAVRAAQSLFHAVAEGDGGSGDTRIQLSKESAGHVASWFFATGFSPRAEIGLLGDDDLHIKVSPDGSAWIDALLFDRASGAAKINAGFFLTGALTPAEITANQNDYNPGGLAGVSALRLSSDAGRDLTGLSGGGDGRIVAITNVGANAIVLKDANVSSSAANRFAFGADVTLGAQQSAILRYDATDARWKLLAAPAGGASGALLAANNLSDLASAAAARTNLGLGALAVLASVDTAQIANNAVDNTKLRDSAALSVLGRGANSTGDPTDIAAGTDGHVLRRSGTALGFGQLAIGAFADGIITFAKLAATPETLGVAAAGTNQTANYTLVLGDAGKTVEMNNAAARTITIPPNASVAFATETYVNLFRQGAGTVEILPGSGVTLRAPNGAFLASQYSMATLRKRGTNEWVLAGDCSTS